jgi:hypothetical protein
VVFGEKDYPSIRSNASQELFEFEVLAGVIMESDIEAKDGRW